MSISRNFSVCSGLELQLKTELSALGEKPWRGSPRSSCCRPWPRIGSLKDATNVLCALVFGACPKYRRRPLSIVPESIGKDAGDRVQKRRLTCAVGPNHGGEVAVFERQVHAAQCALFIDAAREKGLFLRLEPLSICFSVSHQIKERSCVRATFSRISGIESAIATRMAVKSLRSLGRHAKLQAQ